jgi:4-hydroxy-tetrahydrodipicolinate synthase
VVKGGVDYIVVHGTTGESPTVHTEEKEKIVVWVREEIGEELPLVMGFGGSHTDALIASLNGLENLPMDALLSVTPSYNKASQEGLYSHYCRLADGSPHPVILYNVPHRTGVNMEAETTLRLSQHENIIGIKEASGDLMQCARIMKDKPDDFLLISGDDSLTLPLMSLGASGVISVLANAVPARFSDMVHSALVGDFMKARQEHLALLSLLQLANAEGNPASIKAALKALGLCDKYVRLPLTPASAQLERDFLACM